jgi:hypothetical protein
MLAAGGLPLGAAIGGVVTDAASIQAAYLAMSAGAGLSTIIGWLSPLRRADAVTVVRLMAAAE